VTAEEARPGAAHSGAAEQRARDARRRRTSRLVRVRRPELEAEPRRVTRGVVLRRDQGILEGAGILAFDAPAAGLLLAVTARARLASRRREQQSVARLDRDQAERPGPL
jgi:hypothetical protein